MISTIISLSALVIVTGIVAVIAYNKAIKADEKALDAIKTVVELYEAMERMESDVKDIINNNADVTDQAIKVAQLAAEKAIENSVAIKDLKVDSFITYNHYKKDDEYLNNIGG